MSENNGRGLFAILEEAGHDPAESFADRSLLEKTQSVTTDLAQGMLAFPSDQGAKGMNTILDVANAAGIEKAIFKIINGGDMTGFEPRRFAGITDVTKGEREVSALEEGTSDIASVMSSMLITGGTSVGGHILNWGSKGNIGRKVFAEAVTALPADILMSDDSGEHLLFDNNTKEHVIKRRAKNIAENAGMGVIGDFALRGMYKGYKAWRGAGKTSDDATQKVFNESVPAGQADEINKVRPTGELRGSNRLLEVYGNNPMYKIENRDLIDEIVPDVRKQMQNVARAELDHRTAVQDNYVRASESAEIPFDNIHEGVSTETAKRVGLSGVEGAQRRDDYLNIFDTAMSGNIKDKLDEEFTLKFLRSMTDPTDTDVMSILEGGLKGKERESAMRRIREKFRNNPMLMDDAYFKEKANLGKVLTKELGLNKRKPRSLVDEYQDFLIASKTVRSNPKLAKELREWSTKTHLNEATLLKVLPHMKNVTDELPKYMRGFNDVLDKYAKGMVEESENLIKMFKETGNLDVSSPQYQKFISSFLSTSELYEGVAGVRSNVGRALRAIQEGTGSPAESFVAKHSEFYIKGKRDQDAMESASSYLRFAELTRKHQEITAKGVSDGRTPIQIAKDADKTTKELIKLVRGASNLDKAKRMVADGLEGGREDLQDMAISMGIGNLLASPQTLGKIFNSTGIFTLYKQTLFPVWSGIVNMVTRGETGQRPIADLLSSWYGLSRVAKRYASGDAKSMSRGFRGMQIEGQGFNQKTFRGLLDFVNENTNNPITRFGGRLMVAPMWFANQVMNKGIIPIDDFFRRVTMEIETERAIGNMYMRGISTTDNVFQKMSTSFDNIEDYRRSMLPLFTDLRNTLLNSKQWSNNKLEREMNAVFEKYAVTKTDLDARASIMAEIDRIERKGAEAVSQESTQDFLPAVAMRSTLNAIEANVPMGRFVAASLVPFQTAPMNIMRSAIEESGFLAPLSARWRSKFLSRKGSKEHTEAIAQVLSGLTVGMGAWTLVNSMEVYGHIPIEEISSAQELGVQPYSIVINGKAYSYDFLGTFKAPLAMMADYKRYGMAGNNLEAFTKALGTFALSAGNNPYFDSMKELTDFTAGGASTKDWARLLASKSTQFLQFGTGLDRAYDALSGGEQEVSAMNKFYDNVWLRELDQRNKDNPIYRYFRDMTNPKAYVRKTNIFGEGMTRNGGDPSAWGPYLFLGASNLPAPNSPGIVMLKELDLVNRDFTRIGDVQISGQKAQELKKKIFSDSGLGLARLLNHYATSESFMSAPDSYRKKVLSGIINQHTKSVESTFDLETVSKQYELEQIMNQLDYDSRGAEILNNASASQMGEAVYNSGVNKIKKGSITRDKMLEAYK